MKLRKGSKAAKAWGRRMARLRKNVYKFGASARRRKSLKRYVKKYSGGKMKGARTALHKGLVRQLEHDQRTFKRRGLKAWLFGNPKPPAKLVHGLINTIERDFRLASPAQKEQLLKKALTVRGFSGEYAKYIFSNPSRREQGLRKVGYTKKEIQDYANREHLTYSQAVEKLFKHEQQFGGRQGTLEAPELKLLNLMGYKAGGVFHPIRASKDYDESIEHAGDLEAERRRDMREATKHMGGRPRSGFYERMYQARMDKRSKSGGGHGRYGGRGGFNKPLKDERIGKYHVRPVKYYADGSAGVIETGTPSVWGVYKNLIWGGQEHIKDFKKKAAAIKFAQKLAGAKNPSKGAKKNPSGRFHKIYEKLLSILIQTSKGPRELRPRAKTAIYGDKSDRRRVVLVGERFRKDLEGARVLRVDATGNTTKRPDVKKSMKFYHPFTSAARLTHDSAGHLVIKSSRPIWTPRDY